MVPWFSVHSRISLVALVFHCHISFLCCSGIIALAVARSSQFTVSLDFVYHNCLAWYPREIFQEWLEALRSVFITLVAQTVRRLPAMRRPGFDPWIGKVSWRRKWQPTPVFLPEESHGWKSLVGYSPWDRKELTRLSDFTSLMYSDGWWLLANRTILCADHPLTIWIEKDIKNLYLF